MKKYLFCYDEKPNFDRMAFRLLSAWCLVSIEMFFICNGQLSDLELSATFGIIKYVIFYIVNFALISLYVYLFNRAKDSVNADIMFFLLLFSVYTLFSLINLGNMSLALVYCVLWAIVIFYIIKNGLFSVTININDKNAKICVITAGCVFALFAGLMSVLRYETYNSANYDFGIFCNMFYNLKEHFTLNTTCERDMLLSHFAVHFSPIFYVLYPVYLLFPYPETLEIIQVLIVSSGIIPVYLICKSRKMDNKITVFICTVSMLGSVLISGCMTDIHENCFLFPLVLWMFYFFEKDKFIPLIVFAFLTLSVKEDAFIYVLSFALFMIIGRKKYIKGSIIAVISICWFTVAYFILKNGGLGIMSYRYDDFLKADESGLFCVVKNVIENPAYLFSKIFVNEENTIGDKALFIVQMLLPFVFVPFCIKKISNLILVFPMLIINLFTTYSYQFDVGYQYCFGSFAFLIYLAILNAEKMKKETLKYICPMGMVFSVILFSVTGVCELKDYSYEYYTNRSDIALKNEALEIIEDGDSVIASTCILPHIANRDVIYDLDDHEVKDGEKVDWVIIDAQYYSVYEKLEKYKNLGYTVYRTVEGNNGNTLLYILK